MIKYAAFIAVVLLALLVVSQKKGKGREQEIEKIPIEKRPYVFDVVSEFNLYKILLELFSDKYYIFPQIGYAKLVQLKSGSEKWYRNYFDKKVADFVICEKERATARLVIELDGKSHNSSKRIDRDVKVDMMMTKAGIPILHLSTNNLDKDYIRQEILKVLN